MSGMLSIRHDGAGLPELVGKYLGGNTRKVMLVFSVLLLMMVGAVFVYSPAIILDGICNSGSFVGGKMFWIILIFIYYIIATLLPIDKIIGKIYPLFAFSLLLGHGQAQIGVDVDLTHGHGSGLTQLLLGDTHGVGHLAAVLVDHLHVVLGHGRGAVENDGEAGQTLGDLLQHVEAQGRGNQDALLVAGALVGGELVSAVAGADGDGQGVTAGLGDELLDLLRTGIGSSVSGNLNIVLDAGQSAQLSLNHHAVVVSVLNNLLGDLDVLLERLGGGVDHDGGEATVDAALTSLEVGAVIQVQSDGNVGALNDSSLNQLHQVGVVGIGAGALETWRIRGALTSLAASVIPWTISMLLTLNAPIAYPPS